MYEKRFFSFSFIVEELHKQCDRSQTKPRHRSTSHLGHRSSLFWPRTIQFQLPWPNPKVHPDTLNRWTTSSFSELIKRVSEESQGLVSFLSITYDHIISQMLGIFAKPKTKNCSRLCGVMSKITDHYVEKDSEKQACFFAQVKIRVVSGDVESHFQFWALQVLFQGIPQSLCPSSILCCSDEKFPARRSLSKGEISGPEWNPKRVKLLPSNTAWKLNWGSSDENQQRNHWQISFAMDRTTQVWEQSYKASIRKEMA